MLMKMYPSTTCVITLIALLGMYPCQADDPIYATIDEGVKKICGVFQNIQKKVTNAMAFAVEQLS